MRSVHKLALLAAAGIVAVASPAIAEKKKTEESKPAAAALKPKFSKEFIAAYKPVDVLLAKKDSAGAKALWPSVKAAATTDDERYQAGFFAYTVGRDTADNALLVEGLEMLIASSFTPLEMKNTARMQRGQIAYNAKDYATAENFMKQAYDAGFRAGNIEILLSNSFVLRGNNGEALNWVQRAIDNTKAAGGVPDKQWFAQANSYASKLKDPVKMTYWGKEMLKADPRPATYHDAIFQFIYNHPTLDNQESLDILRLARKTNSILRDHEYNQYLEYADARRYPAEALGILEEGFAKGVISKSNASFGELYAVAQQRSAELRVGWDADEKAALADPKGFSALLFGETLLSFGEYARAERLLQAAVSKASVIDREGKDQIDRARTRLGIAKAMQGNNSGAKVDFQAIKNANRKLIAEYWLIYIANQGA